MCGYTSVRIAMHERPKDVKDHKREYLTGALGVYIRERGYAEVKPPSRVIVAAVNRGSLNTAKEGVEGSSTHR